MMHSGGEESYSPESTSFILNHDYPNFLLSIYGSELGA